LLSIRLPDPHQQMDPPRPAAVLAINQPAPFRITHLDRQHMVIADRVCGAKADPIIRNEQERRQLALLAAYLEGRGYRKAPRLLGRDPKELSAGSFCTRAIVSVHHGGQEVNIPIDLMVQPHQERRKFEGTEHAN
jgi:type II restriction enzyme